MALALVAALWAAPGPAAPLGEDEQVFVDQMVRKHGFDRAELTSLLQDAEFQQGIIDAISKPAESKPWYLYRPIMLTRERIEGGVEFWNANAAALARAEAQYGARRRSTVCRPRWSRPSSVSRPSTAGTPAAIASWTRW